MKSYQKLSNDDHPAVQTKANDLASGKATTLEKLESIFFFVRDGIPFGFPPKWDNVKASETLAYGIGYCTTKATLLTALCQAAGIPARIHAGLINLDIMRGIFPGFSFPFLPKTGGHAWSEVEIDGAWLPVDSYITDKPFFEGALKRLEGSGEVTKFGLSIAKGPVSCEFNFGEKGFTQMGGVVEDHGAWADYSDYMATDKYLELKGVQLWMFLQVIRKMANSNIRGIRSS